MEMELLSKESCFCQSLAFGRGENFQTTKMCRRHLGLTRVIPALNKDGKSGANRVAPADWLPSQTHRTDKDIKGGRATAQTKISRGKGGFILKVTHFRYQWYQTSGYEYILGLNKYSTPSSGASYKRSTKKSQSYSLQKSKQHSDFFLCVSEVSNQKHRKINILGVKALAM